MDKKQFWNEVVPAKMKNNINTAAAIAFVSTAVTAVTAIMVEPLMFVDAILILILGLGIKILKSRICAVILLIYFVLSKCLMFSLMTASSMVMAFFFTAAYALGVYGTFCYHSFKRDYEAQQQA